MGSALILSCLFPNYCVCGSFVWPLYPQHMTCWEIQRREARQQDKSNNRNTPIMEGDMTVREREEREREREGRRLPYRTPQGWDYLLHQSAIAQQKRTGNNTVKPSVCLITRSSIKYNSSSQPECTTGISPGICLVKIKSYMRSYKIFIYMLWWYVRTYRNCDI